MTHTTKLAVAVGAVGGLLAASGAVGVWPALLVVVVMLTLCR